MSNYHVIKSIQLKHFIFELYKFVEINRFIGLLFKNKSFAKQQFKFV